MLNVNEVYPAICGESRFSGRPCTLVRLTGCHRRCVWCDSAHAFHEGTSRTTGEVLAEVAGHGFTTVLVTGGEPLLQREVLPLLRGLVADGRTVLLETSGTALPSNAATLAEVPSEVHRIVDLKAPGSGVAVSELDWPGVAGLMSRDELKIVCADRDDYIWARDLVGGGRLPAGVPVLLSPVHGLLEPRQLAEWILADKLEVRFQTQLHKEVWPDRERGV